MNNILHKYADVAGTWQSKMVGYANWLFWGLVLLSMVWTFGMMALKNAGLTEALAEMVRFFAVTGFFWWILSNGPAISMSIIDSMRMMAANASGVGNSLSPSGIVDIAFSILEKTMAAADFWSPVVSAIMLLTAISVLVVMALIAVNMVLLLVAAWFLAYGGVFLLGFGGGRWSTDIAINYYKTVLGLGVQIFAMILLVGIGQSFVDQYYSAFQNGKPDLNSLCVLLVSAVVLLVLVTKIPPMLAGIVGGGASAGSLPDLWNAGVDPRIFGFINVQGLNPTQRPLFETPPRAYNVVGALRLAKLIGSIRKVQKDVPITVVCHSQGNMVGIAAAFLGDRLSGRAGVRCVADTYVLANPPYGIVGSIEGDNSPFMEDWTERNDKDPQGNRGRVESQARANTLKAFFELIAQSKDAEDKRDPLDIRMTMANMKPGEDGKPAYDPDQDRKQYGVQNHTYGRVTLYSCPHDQVISAAPVQGMGWRGLHPDEVELVKGSSLFTQRVFATNFQVGQAEPVTYDTWKHDWRYGKGSSELFFYPTSPPAKYNLVKALRGNPHWYGKVGTIAFAPVLYIVTMATSAMGLMRVNADPPKKCGKTQEGWHVICDAPGLPEPFFPQAIRYGAVVHVKDGDAESDFNEDNDPVAAQRNKNKASIDKTDPYDTYKSNDDEHAEEMAPHGDASTEASQRYEDHAIARMEARHKGNPEWVKDGEVVGEAGPNAQMPDGYQKWRNKEIVHILDAAVNKPTNHSTIMTNPKHARLALTYDVAIGICRISNEQLNQFRIEADWRFGESLDKVNPNKIYSAYFEKGKMNGDFLQNWVLKDPEATLPESINDKRQGGVLLGMGRVG
ncbi:P-type conjugative transfer protein TrbL [Burkholderia cepacia]|uniref:P-type conjugative transfer protein TrbL n=1 Tax=Burkholderia cepacia TaxID=292 RepID=UPI00076CFE2B|nr:P-type conjugative transfer protein TrbL [Burkholderia cepacia]KVQ25910.1 hypothetical protein WK01_20565 [Burkholderia cepacia]